MLRRILCASTLLFLMATQVSAKTYTIGGARPATLLTPTEDSTKQQLPLLVFLHGYTSNGQQADSFFGVSSQRDPLDFAVIIADGTKNSEGNRFWNATPECCDFEESGVDDAAYIANLITEAKTVTSIDSAKVYVMGHSNGAFMSYRMACEYPELLRGIISISGAFFKDPNLCKNPGTLKILHIHGSVDPTIPFEGSSYFPSTQTSLDYWISKNNCGEGALELGALDLVLASGSSSAVKETDSTVWENCQSETKVGLWKINGTGHVPFFNADWLAAALKFVE
jgi:polyhydroxybutyrate depolymerase